MSTTDRQAFCSGLEAQLVVLEGQVRGVIEKERNATSVEKSAMSEMIERFPEAAMKARRQLAALKQDGPEFEQEKDSVQQSWDELRALVENAKAAYGG